MPDRVDWFPRTGDRCGGNRKSRCAFTDLPMRAKTDPCRRVAGQAVKRSTIWIKGFIMDKDRITGSAKVVAGKAKAALGSALGDAKLQADGTAEQVEGKLQNAVGSIKDAVKDAKNHK